MKETDLYEQIASYMCLAYPNILFRFDMGGVWTPSHKARNLYGKLNKRAWPDLFIAKPKITNYKGYYGLFIEIKTITPYLKDGVTLKKNDHLVEQDLMLKSLRSNGYQAEFGWGFDNIKQMIDDYLN